MDKYVVLVTGSNGGIGTEICNKFHKEGWYVIGLDLTEESKHFYCDKYYKANLIENGIHKIIIDKIKEEIGKLDCIVNNAAFQVCKSIWETEEYEWDNIMNCNLKTIYLFAKYSINMLKESKNPNIINIGSVHSLASSDKIAAYACSKSALVGLTRNLAIELGKFNIRVNCVSPGGIITNMLLEGLNRTEITLNEYKNKHILKDVGYPSDISNIVYMCTQSNFMTGSNIIIDGGATITLGTEKV